MSWRGIDGALAAAASGPRHGAVAVADALLRQRQGDASYEPPGRETVIRSRTSTASIPAAADQPQQRSHVLGLQANIWTEHIRTAERVQEMTFPRAAAVAEVGWSSPRDIDWRSFVRRLPRELDRYRALGLQYSTDIFAVKSRRIWIASARAFI